MTDQREEALRLLRAFKAAWEAAPPGLRQVGGTTPALTAAVHAIVAADL